MKLGERLKKLIKLRGYNAKSLSDALHMPSHNTIYNIINDKSVMSPDVLQQIIRLIPDANPLYLTGDSDEMFLKSINEVQIQSDIDMLNTIKNLNEYIKKLKDDIESLKQQNDILLKKSMGGQERRSDTETA